MTRFRRARGWRLPCGRRTRPPTGTASTCRAQGFSCRHFTGVAQPAARTIRAFPMTELTIESLDQEGRGIAHADGKVVFVEGGLPGERVSAETVKRKLSFEI